MRYIRSIFLASLLLVMISPPVWASWASKSTEYKAGKVAAYLDYCGYYGLNSSLYDKFGSSQEYRDSEHENDLSGADSVSGLDCDLVKQVAKQLLGNSSISKNYRGVPEENSYREQRLKEQTGYQAAGSTISEHKSNESNSDRKICLFATTQSYFNGPLQWSSTQAMEKYVNEAKSRGLTEQDCARILGSSTSGEQYYVGLCRAALNPNGTITWAPRFGNVGKICEKKC